MDSESSKRFVDLKLVHGVESRMVDYTEIDPPMETEAAGGNAVFGTVQGILMVVLRDTIAAKLANKTSQR